LIVAQRFVLPIVLGMESVTTLLNVNAFILTLDKIVVSLFVQATVRVTECVGMELVIVIKDGLVLIVEFNYVIALVMVLVQKVLLNVTAIRDGWEKDALNYVVLTIVREMVNVIKENVFVILDQVD